MSGIRMGRGRRTPRPRRLACEPLEDRRLLSVFATPAELQEYLIQDALARYEHLFGQPAWSWWPWLTDVTASGTGSSTPARQSEQALDYSETNTQTPGVDEADLVETDGDYLYVLSGRELVILDSWPATEVEVQVVSRTELAGRPLGQYLWGDRLAVLSEGPPVDILAPGAPMPAIEVVRPWPTYEPHLTLTVLDISDRQNPQLVQKTEVEGSLVASRAIGNYVYLVMHAPFVLPGPEPIPAEPGVVVPKPPGDGQGAFDLAVVDGVADWIGSRIPPPGDLGYVYETKEQYLARIAAQVLDLALPNFTSVDAEEGVVAAGLLGLPPDIRRPRGPEEVELTTVVVFDMASDAPGPVFSLGVPGQAAGPVYVSQQAIYLPEPVWAPPLPPPWPRLPGVLAGPSEQTRITRLQIEDDGRVSWSAEGVVPGHVPNAFSMDETAPSGSNGQAEVLFRVVTTQGWGATATSGVYVLGLADSGGAEQTGQLEIIGRLEGLEPGEQLYSARFLQDKTYLVTFLRVDPLLVVDLSDPTQPSLAGELEIPGFSNYLHPVEGGYLIGIGRNADPATGQWREPQVSLFDVRDPKEPVLLDRYTVDVGPWGWSEAFSDHHAVSYFPDQRVLTLTVTSAGWWLPGPDHCYLPPKTQLLVFRIDVASAGDPDDPGVGSGETTPSGGKIELLGTIEHDQPVRRTVRIEDYLYAVSQDTLSVHELLKPEKEILRLYFGKRLADLGPVEWREVADAVVEPGDPWYTFEAVRDGLVTVEVASPAGPDRVRLTLYDEQLRPLADSTPAAGIQRIDWSGQAGKRYYVRVSRFDTSDPSNESFTLRVANRVQRSDNLWTVFGALGDRLELRLDRGQLTLNGLSYALPPELTQLDLRGAAQGATAVVRGLAEGHTVTLRPGEVAVQAGPLAVRLRDWAEATVEAAASTTAQVFADAAVPGRISLFPSGAVWTDGSVKNVVRFASTLLVHGAPGQAVDVYGSNGDDVLEVHPGWLELTRPGYTARLESFGTVVVHANQGGFDTARLAGSAGADYYVGQPGWAILGGAGYSVTLEGFESVEVEGGGGQDAAWLFDTPADDLLSVEPGTAVLAGGGWSHRIEGFARVEARASAGGSDTAQGRLAADQLFESFAHFVRVRGGGETLAFGFEEVQAQGSPSGSGARLFDSPGDDRLEAAGRLATLTYPDHLVQAADFAWVQAQSMRGGTDRKRQEAVDMALELLGQWLDE